MATSGTVIERFAQASGYLPSTLDRMLRSLRSGGLVPMGEKGRGQRQGHYEASHLANLLMGFGGAQPADAADAAILFRELPYRWSTGPPVEDVTRLASEGEKLYEPGVNFGQALENMIQVLARIDRDEVRKWMSILPADLAFPPGPLPREIRLTLRLPSVETIWLGPTNRTHHYFSSENHDLASPAGVRFNCGVTRMTSIRGEMIVVASELLRGRFSQ